MECFGSIYTHGGAGENLERCFLNLVRSWCWVNDILIMIQQFFLQYTFQKNILAKKLSLLRELSGPLKNFR